MGDDVDARLIRQRRRRTDVVDPNRYGALRRADEVGVPPLDLKIERRSFSCLNYDSGDGEGRASAGDELVAGLKVGCVNPA